MKSLGHGYGWDLIFYVSKEFCLKESLQKRIFTKFGFWNDPHFKTCLQSIKWEFLLKNECLKE